MSGISYFRIDIESEAEGPMESSIQTGKGVIETKEALSVPLNIRPAPTGDLHIPCTDIILLI